jgi:GNAT superfamily N-acetyltransferase
MKIRLAIEKDVSQINQLLNFNLSFGLSTEEKINHILENIFVSEIEDKIVGMSFLTEINKEDLIEEFFHHKEILDKIKIEEKNNLIKLLVVDKEYRRIGIGTKLISESLSNKEAPCFAIGWVQRDFGFQAESILKKIGFKEVVEIKQFWLEDSLNNNYGCPYCSDYFCTCSAKIFYRKKL